MPRDDKKPAMSVTNPLLDLPPEIRAIIYDFLLSDQKAFPTTVRLYHNRYSNQINYPIAQVCSLLRHEILVAIFNRLTPVFETINRVDRAVSLSWINALDDVAVENIGQIRLQSTRCDRHDEWRHGMPTPFALPQCEFHFVVDLRKVECTMEHTDPSRCKLLQAEKWNPLLEQLDKIVRSLPAAAGGGRRQLSKATLMAILKAFHSRRRLLGFARERFEVSPQDIRIGFVTYLGPEDTYVAQVRGGLIAGP